MKKAFVHKIDDNIQSKKCAQECYCDRQLKHVQCGLTSLEVSEGSGQ